MIVADENIPAPVVEALQAGHEVLYIGDVAPSTDDEDVLERARAAGALLTADKDFGELAFLRRLVTSGVVLLRLGEVSDQEQGQRVLALFAAHAAELPAAFTVVTADRVRIRAVT